MGRSLNPKPQTLDPHWGADTVVSVQQRLARDGVVDVLALVECLVGCVEDLGFRG